jgi:hypothetical protein
MSKLGAKLATGRLIHWTNLDGMREWERLQAELATLQTVGVKDDREVGDPKQDLARQIIELEQQMDASGVAFDLSAIPAKRWLELRAENTTDDDTQTEMSDADYWAFINAVMREPDVVASVTRVADGSPIEFDAASDWDDEVKTMTLAQWTRFAEKLKELNQNRVGAPKSRLASLMMRASDKS